MLGARGLCVIFALLLTISLIIQYLEVTVMWITFIKTLLFFK